MKVIFKYIVAAAFILLALNPMLVYAEQTSNTTTESQQALPTYNAGVDQSISDYLCTPSQPADGHDLERCVNRLYRFSITAGSIVVVFFIVLAGYMYITGGETGKGKGKAMLFNALTGLAIILTSYVLLYFINPSLVVIKPIQPPIFTADDLPTCDEVGFEDDCLLADGTSINSTSGFGAKIACPSGQIVSAKGLGLPTKQSDEQICKPFGEKLLGLKSSLSGINWYITDTIGSGHLSQCHKAGNSYSGTCADIGISEKNTTNWNRVCKAILSLGNVQPVNEADSKATDCPKYGTYSTTTGAHIHANWRSGGGSPTASSSSGGSRPNCIANKEFSFLCDSPGGDPYPEGENKSSDSTIQANINEVIARLKKAGISVAQAKQLYRPHQYGAHLRSYWEAFALISGKDDAYVKSTGFFCDGSIQYVKKSDIDKLTTAQKNKIKDHFAKIHKGSLAFNTTCMSDHGFGYAVDYGAGSNADVAKLEKVGLCHSLPGGKWNQNRDGGHYVLKEKNRNTQGCKSGL